MIRARAGLMLHTSEIWPEVPRMYSSRGSSTANEHHCSFIFFPVDHKSEIAHRYNDLKEETFKAV